MDPDKWESLDSLEASSGVMVSNLPLLFARGLPTALHQMSSRDLETFLPFMVRCSVSVDQSTAWSQLPRPPWWPTKLPFRVPTHANSMKAVVKLIQRCYAFHGSEYLLEFCASLLQMQPECGYRYTDNRDGTTSMYHGSTGKLLVTFRNENRDYDKVLTPKPTLSQKKLLPSNRAPHSHGGQTGSIMVRPPITDVYLCDKCDEEFSLLKEVQAHERTCNGDRPLSPKMPSPEPEIPEYDQDPENQIQFLSHFGLNPAKHTGIAPYVSPRKRAQTPAKISSFTNYARYDTVPLCSPMGSFILKRCKYGGKLQMTQHQVMKNERYVQATSESDIISTRERSSNRWVVVWKKRDEPPWSHLYVFNKEELREKLKTIESGLNGNSRVLLLQCRGAKIKLKRLSRATIDRYKRPKKPPEVPCIDLTTVDEDQSHVAKSKPNPQTCRESKPFIPTPLNSMTVEIDPLYIVGSPDKLAPLDKIPPAQNGTFALQLHPLTPPLTHKKSLNCVNDMNRLNRTLNNIKSQEKSALRSVRNAFHSNHQRPILPQSKIEDPAKVSGASGAQKLKTISPKKENLLQLATSKLVPPKPIEVIDLSSDDEETAGHANKRTPLTKDTSYVNPFPSAIQASNFSENYSTSKNGYSHWSSMESFSLHGRSVRDLATNGIPPCSVPPSPTPSPSPTSSNSFIFPNSEDSTLAKHETSGASVYKENYEPFPKKASMLPGISLDDEISFKSPLQVDEEISFSFQHNFSPPLQAKEPEIKVKIEPTADDLPHEKWSEMSIYSPYQSCDTSKLGFYDKYAHSLLCCEKNQLSTKAPKTSQRSKSCELKKLLADECRELGKLGLDSLRRNDLASKKRITRFYAEKNNVLHTRKNRYVVYPKKCLLNKPQIKEVNSSRTPKEYSFCPNTETFSTTKPVLQSSHLTCQNLKCCFTKEQLKQCIQNTTLLATTNNNNDIASNNNISGNNNNLNNYSIKDCPNNIKLKESPSNLESENKVEVLKKRRPSLSKRRRPGLNREISMLIRDECKEIKDLGFHPTHILGTVYTDIHSDEDLDITPYSPTKKSLLSYSRKSASPTKLKSEQTPTTTPEQIYTKEGNTKDLLVSNKRLQRELAKLMKDEWKELKRSGHHPSQIPELLSNIRNLRSTESKEPEAEKSCLISRRRLSWTVNRDYSLSRSTRQQAKIISCMQIETPRSAHRDLIQNQSGMCVINFTLPTIQ